MFVYEDNRHSYNHDRYGEVTMITTKIFDAGVLVGYIERRFLKNGDPLPVSHWNADAPFDCGYYAKTGKWNSQHHIDYCVNVADGKRKFSAWYQEHKNMTARNTDVRALPASPDAEFFPTPSALAGRMARYIDWRKVSTILEPSAGKGDLLNSVFKCAQRKNSCRDDHWPEITDCVEIDPNLRMILDGKGFRVVGDDFLSFFPFKKYDLIVMNPPFSNGDEHLLKALSLVENSGGQIVCLLNAETIRNPYTNRRKVLAQKLAEHEAKIEFIEGAFKRAERRSDVEVAIIYLNIPQKKEKSNIVEGLKKAQEEKFAGADHEAITSGNWMEQLVAGYEFEAKAGISLMEEYNALAPYIMSGSNTYDKPLIQLSVNDHSVQHASADTINDFLRKLRYKYWNALLNHKELTDKMTSDIANELHDRIRELQDYDFSMFNIKRFLREISMQFTRGVEEAIEKLFVELSAKHAWYSECSNNIHYYNGWATNKAHKVNMKVILPINAYYCCYDGKKKLEAHEFVNKISDLELALNYLERGEVCFRCDPYNVARFAESRQCGTMDFTYFTATFYKKGTCHIKFKPEFAPVIDRLNIFAARKRNWLPPDYGKKKYADMDAESRAVIDEFQGEAAYAEVMRAPENFIIAPAAALPQLTA